MRSRLDTGRRSALPRPAALDPVRQCALVVVVYAVVVAGVTLPTPLYVTYQERWALTNLGVTLLYALYPAGVLVVVLLAGHWSDSVGRRAVVAIALACSALSGLALLASTSVALVAAARLLTGLASGFVVNAANALLVELAVPARRRLASLVSTGTNQVGIGLGAGLSGLLVQYAWAPTRLVYAGHVMALGVAALCLRLVPETLPTTGRLSLRVPSLRFPARDRAEFLAASLASFSAFALCGLLAALAPAIVREQLGHDNAALAGGAVAAVFIASGTTQFAWARLPNRRTVLGGLAALVGGLAGMTGSLHGESFPLFALSAAVGGVGVGAVFMGSLATVNARAGGQGRGRITSTYFAITFSGLILPVLGTGLAADHLSQFQATAAFATGIGAVALLSAVLLLRVSASE
ncbi:MAG: mdfA [Nocardioides sp.]|nr:mdfA [Nocardioides sp.]